MIPTAPDPVLVGVGGAAGALLRAHVGRRLGGEGFPVATLAVNVLGSFALALVTFFGVGDRLLLAVGTGACGAFTTFSSFAVETVRLWEAGRRAQAAANAAGNLLGSGGAVGLAYLLVGSAA